MKTKITIFILLFWGFFSLAQSNTANDEKSVYKLYPTTNISTFLKLDTSIGQVFQVHFDITGDERVEYIINPMELVNDDDVYTGRFELYPTQNMYNFLLLDKKDGRIWQTQWSHDWKNRGILPFKTIK